MASNIASTASKVASSQTTSVWSLLSSYPRSHPFIFGVVVSGFKTSFSDLLVQKVVEKREEVDWKRNLAFATFGFVYLGGVQYALYVPIFGRIFPNAASFASKTFREKVKDGKGVRSLFGQVFLDQCVHHPLAYFPAFYCIKESVMSDKPDYKRTLLEYKSNLKEDLLALWKVWVPSALLNFAFMPMWARVPWVAGTSLVWTCILSAMRGGAVKDGKALAGGGVDRATMQIMTDGLREMRTSPVELDPSLSHICVAASGPDKVGWVAIVARVIADSGGNITHSRMVRFGHDFTILMHVSVRPDQQRALISTLQDRKDLEPLNLKISSLTRRQTKQTQQVQTGIRIHCVGEDKPGMLAAISEDLVRRGMSVEDITTELRLTKDGKRNFVINAECTTHQKLDKEHLDAMLADLSKLKTTVGLDILDIRVHTD